MNDFSINILVAIYKEFCESANLFICNNKEKIGGPEITVQIDECHFGKRKYNIGYKLMVLGY